VTGWRIALIVVACWAISFGAAFGLTRVVAADEGTDTPARSDDVAAATVDASVPVIAPIATGDPNEAILIAAQANAGEPAPVSPVVSAVAARNATTGARTTTDTSALSAYAGRAPEPDAVPLVPMGAPAHGDPAPDAGRFVDPCAAPGDDATESCAAEGSGGGVVPRDGTPLWVEVITTPDRFDRVDPGWRRCSFPDDPSGGAPVVVVTSSPVEAVTLTSRPRSQPAGGPDERTHDIGATTTDEQNAYKSRGYDAERWYRNVQHCARLEPAGSEPTAIRARVSGADTSTTTGSALQWLAPPADNPRPPVVITFEDETMHVATPVRSDQQEATVVTVLAADGSDGVPSCAAFDTNPGAVDELTRAHRRSVGDPSAAQPFPGAGSDTNPDYDRVLAHDFRLPEGTAWLVCITWTTQPESFDHGINGREQWSVTMPSRTRVRVVWDGVSLAGETHDSSFDLRVTASDATNPLTVRSADGDESECAQSLTIADGAAGFHRNETEEALCDPQGLTGELPATFDVVARVDERSAQRSRVVVDSSQHGVAQSFSVPLTQTRSTCGESPFGAIGLCDPPDAVGTALFHLAYDAPHAGRPERGAAVPDGAYETPVTAPNRPQLDFSPTDVDGVTRPASNVRAGARVDDLVVDLVPDRDVDAHVYVLGHDRGDTSQPCLRPYETGETIAHIAANTKATLTIPGLCAGNVYYVVAEVTDGSGATATYAPHGLGTGTDAWDADVFTNHYRVHANVTLTYSRTRVNREDLAHSILGFGSLRLDFSNAGRNAVDPVFGCLGTGASGTRANLAAELYERVDYAGQVTVARGSAARDACRIDARSDFVGGDAAKQFDVEQLLANRVADLHIDIRDGPAFDYHVEILDHAVVPT
jgi:hypothetical protein